MFSFIRRRFHPLWRLRRSQTFRQIQRRWDKTVFVALPGTQTRVALRLLRDVNWILNCANIEPRVRAAFDLIFHCLRPEIFWDVGANVGFYSWYARQQPCIQQICMFEPDATNFGLIERTIVKNAIVNCLPIQAALSDQVGQAAFLVDHASGAAGALEAVSQRENTQSLHVVYEMNETICCRTETIDHLIENGLPAPDLLKIDVEGAEKLVVAGGKKLLAETRPTLIAETIGEDFARLVDSLGYVTFRIDEENVLCLDASQVDLAPFHEAFGAKEHVSA